MLCQYIAFRATGEELVDVLFSSIGDLFLQFGLGFQ
jgi:hypothetical protein